MPIVRSVPQILQGTLPRFAARYRLPPPFGAKEEHAKDDEREQNLCQDEVAEIEQSW